MKFEDFEFYQWPPRWDQKPYEKAREEIVERFSKIDEIEALVEWGTTTFPGISDLDIYVLLKEDCEQFHFPGYWSFEGLTRETLHHDFFLIPSHLYRDNINYLDPWIVEHKILWGDPRNVLPERPHVGEEDQWLRLDHVNDFITIIWSILSYLRSKKIPVITILDMLPGVAYSVREVNRYHPVQIETDFFDRLNSLRNLAPSDQSKKTKQVIFEMIDESLHLFAQVLISLSQLLEKKIKKEEPRSSTRLKSWLKNNGVEAALLTTRGCLLYREIDLDPSELVKMWKSRFVDHQISVFVVRKQITCPVLDLPYQIAAFYGSHLQAQGAFTALRREQFLVRDYNFFIPCASLKKRSQLWDDCWTWLKKRRHPKSGGKPPFAVFDIPLDITWKRGFFQSAFVKAWPRIHTSSISSIPS